MQFQLTKTKRIVSFLALARAADPKHKAFDQIFKITFLIIGVVPVWFLPISWAAMVISNTLYLMGSIIFLNFIYSAQAKDLTKSWRLALISLTTGVAMIGFYLIMSPDLRHEAILVLSRKWTTFYQFDDTHPHAVPGFYVGIFWCYASLMYILRLILLKVLDKFSNSEELTNN